MNRSFTDDIQKLVRETGLTHDEARRLLLLACGDYRRALRMHQEAFTVYIEPESVEDAPYQTAARALHALNCACAAVMRAVKTPLFRRSLVLILIMLALAGAPKISLCSLLVLMMVRLAAPRVFAGSPA